MFTTEYNGNAIDDEIITSPYISLPIQLRLKSLSLTYDLNEPGIIKLSVFIKGQLVARIDRGTRVQGKTLLTGMEWIILVAHYLQESI